MAERSMPVAVAFLFGRAIEEKLKAGSKVRFCPHRHHVAAITGGAATLSHKGNASSA
jgi:hypothetical protein